MEHRVSSSTMRVIAQSSCIRDKRSLAEHVLNRRSERNSSSGKAHARFSRKSNPPKNRFLRGYDVVNLVLVERNRSHRRR